MEDFRGHLLAIFSLVLIFIVFGSIVDSIEPKPEEDTRKTLKIEVVHYGHTKDTIVVKTYDKPFISEDETGLRVLYASGAGIVSQNVKSFKVIQ